MQSLCFLVLLGVSAPSGCEIGTPKEGCDTVIGACPELPGTRSLWGGCEGAAWLEEPVQCGASGCAPVVDYGVTLHPDGGEGYAEPWAVCTEGYHTIEGVICHACD